MALSQGGCPSYILNGDVIRTKVSGHYREGGRSSGVAIKRGSTVVVIITCGLHHLPMLSLAYTAVTDNIVKNKC